MTEQLKWSSTYLNLLCKKNCVISQNMAVMSMQVYI